MGCAKPASRWTGAAWGDGLRKESCDAKGRGLGGGLATSVVGCRAGGTDRHLRYGRGSLARGQQAAGRRRRFRSRTMEHNGRSIADWRRVLPSPTRLHGTPLDEERGDPRRRFPKRTPAMFHGSTRKSAAGGQQPAGPGLWSGLCARDDPSPGVATDECLLAIGSFCRSRPRPRFTRTVVPHPRPLSRVNLAGCNPAG